MLKRECSVNAEIQVRSSWWLSLYTAQVYVGRPMVVLTNGGAVADKVTFGAQKVPRLALTVFADQILQGFSGHYLGRAARSGVES